MGGASDHSQRSSSPLKRRASELEPENISSQDDVDMIPVPSTDPTSADSTSKSALSPRPKNSPSNVLQEESEPQSGEGNTAAETRGSPTTAIPPIDVQINTITTLVRAAQEQPPNPGDEVYLVSKRWLNRVISRGSEARKSSKEEPEGEIGPVDNSDIIKEIIKDSNGEDFVQLKPGYGEQEFEPFSKDAWDMVVEWYGLMQGSKPIVRVAYNTNTDAQGIPNVLFEYHPPVFRIHRLHGENNNIIISQKLKVSNPAAPVFVFSRSSKYQDFLKKVKNAADIPLTKKVRVWRVPRQLAAAEPVAPIINNTTPPSSRPSSPTTGNATVTVQSDPQDSWTQLFLDIPSFTQLERGVCRELVDFADHSANSKYNGGMSLLMAGLGDDQTIVLDEQTTGDSYVSNTVASKNKTSSSSALARTNGNSQTNSGRSSPAPSGGPMTRGRTQKAGRRMGTTGLSNLGNTCYMNSALQCVRSVEELTKYFLTNTAKGELNVDNPLGNNGDVAKAYESLLMEIYKDPAPTSVAPRYFKSTIGRYAPSFSGWGQQDSQEFLGFLLDGLQEDLSRVLKKPYIEKPDSTDEMVNNPEAIREMAAQVWDITKKRDDSVIADLFTGMYKSTLVCPVCAKVSITFDPFNNLTLQLPIENSWSHEVYYYPLNHRPVKMSIDIDKHAPISVLKQFVSKRVGVPVKRLFPAEEFKHKFYKTYEDTDIASDAIGNSDFVGVHELEYEPSNWPPPEKPKKEKSYLSFNNYTNNSDEDDLPSWEDPVAARLLVPVFHRRPNGDRPTNKYAKAKAWVLDGVPHFITLTPDEARSEEAIKRKILEKIATFSTSSLFEPEEQDHSVADSADTDIILTTSSDADSSGDSKVVAHSVDGEEGLVDVTMNGTGNAADSAESTTAPDLIIPRFTNRRPAFVPAGSYLPAELQNMFTMGYFMGSKEYVPTGWHTVDDDKTYPTISSRNPYLSRGLDSSSTSGYEVSVGRAGSETSENENFNSATRMNDESSDEDIPATIQRPVALPLRMITGRDKSWKNKGRNNKKTKTYSKKGKQSARKSPDTNDSEQDAPDDGPLIRLGEGIVVDWSADAWDRLFDGEDGQDSFRGRRTWGKNEVQDLPDPELEAKRKARTARRRNGITLDDCLDEFGKEEILSEQDTWYCPRCKEHRRATKKFELWKTPDILVMHLKRFSSAALRRDKLDVLVEFPIEGLDLTSRVIETEDGKHEIYDLFAVDDHYGGLGGGHYTAFARNFIDGQWYEYNDSSASMLKDVSRVVSPSAYLLFYRRRSDKPLGGPRFQEIFDKFEKGNDISEDEESGEDQGLAGDSSQLGSSRALTGVGAVRRANGSQIGGKTTTINPKDLNDPPPYSHIEDTLALLESGETTMHDDLRPSVEADDEGVDVNMGEYSSINTQNLSQLPQSAGYHTNNWTFAGLNTNTRQMVSGVGSDIDGASDIVNADSSASATSIENRIQEFEDAPAEDDLGTPYEDQSYVPDLDEEEQAVVIGSQMDMYGNLDLEYSAVPYEQHEKFEVEETVTDIHLSDNDDLKMD